MLKPYPAAQPQLVPEHTPPVGQVTQVPPQLVCPAGQTQLVPEHTPPDGQVVQVPPQHLPELQVVPLALFTHTPVLQVWHCVQVEGPVPLKGWQ